MAHRAPPENDEVHPTMAIQIASIPQQDAIAARLRREGIYDTEGFNDAIVTTAGLTLFRSATSFGRTGLSEVKVFGRDTNIIGQGGQLPNSWHHYWYGVRGKFSALNQRLDTAANSVVFDQWRRLVDMSWFEFDFGLTPFFFCQLSEIPTQFPAHISQTQNATTLYEPANNIRDPKHRYDVTIESYPIEITSLETIQVKIPLASDNTLPTLTLETYVTILLVGTLMKGISG